MLINAALLAGESTVCFDGQYFFDTDHSEGDSGSQSNDITFDISDAGSGGTAAAPTPPSTVALPPMASNTCSAPYSMAAWMSWPVPNVVVSRGLY